MPRRWWSLVAVGLATFSTYLDNNVTNVAIPTIQRDLHLSIAGLEWVVSSYILVFAGLLLVGGRLADVYGRRRLFVVGLSVFTLASLGAGLAGSGGVLIAARLAQGLGAALMVPTTLAIIVATFDDARERTRAVGAWAAIGALALAFGPLIGGFISQHLHWGWIFLINVPVGVITMGIALASIRESRNTSAGGNLDVPGLAASAVALFSLTYALIEGHDKGWTSATILGALALAVLAAGVFTLIESRTGHPMVELSLFRSRAFSGGTGTMMLWAFGISASTSSRRCTCRGCWASRRPGRAWPSCRWRCAWRCSPGSAGRSRPGSARTGPWRSAWPSTRSACPCSGCWDGAQRSAR